MSRRCSRHTSHSRASRTAHYGWPSITCRSIQRVVRRSARRSRPTCSGSKASSSGLMAHRGWARLRPRSPISTTPQQSRRRFHSGLLGSRCSTIPAASWMPFSPGMHLRAGRWRFMSTAMWASTWCSMPMSGHSTRITLPVRTIAGGWSTVGEGVAISLPGRRGWVWACRCCRHSSSIGATCLMARCFPARSEASGCGLATLCEQERQFPFTTMGV